MRIKESLTIDEDLSTWIKNQEDYKSASEFVNTILRREYNSRGDVFIRIRELDQEELRIQDKRRILFDKLIKVIEEGNKLEREEAVRLLEKHKKLEDMRKARLIFCYNRLKELNFLGKLDELQSDNDINDLVKEIYKITILEGKNIISSVGFFDLKRILDLKNEIDFENLKINKEVEQ